MQNNQNEIINHSNINNIKETLTVSPPSSRNNSVINMNSNASSSSSTPSNGSNSTTIAAAEEEKKHLENSLAFGANRETLVAALNSSSSLVSNLQAFNQEKWTIHYPHQLGLVGTSTSKLGMSASVPSSPRSGMKSAGGGNSGSSGESNSSSRASRTRSSSLRRSSSLQSVSLEGGEDSDDDNESVSSSTSNSNSNSYSRSNGNGNGNSNSVKRPSLSGRSFTTAETLSRVSSSTNLISTHPNTTNPHHPLSILSLDLKLGHPSSPTASLPALLPSLSLTTLSQLLSRRLTTSLAHLASLKARVIDTSSRILVTGDLNAGKSTLVNALLRREVMPSDQQPCTTVFCEVLDAESYNNGKEEIHAIKSIELYNKLDPTTFDWFDLKNVDQVQDLGDDYQIIKAYVTDARGMIESSPSSSNSNSKPLITASPLSTATEELPLTTTNSTSTSLTTTTEGVNSSFIKNGLVSISLIDAPGLNRDTLSTTALFARQSEIDVIVFVVSAENHFTLSAKEFLWNASREKAYVFIVVNKFKGIKDKARCMRIVGEQIQQLSPATWENRNELVHFVDAADVIESGNNVGINGTSKDSIDPEDDVAFDHLEKSLRSFVLLKRSKSKLAPAKHYLLNLLSDLSTLTDTNVTAATNELTEALILLDKVKPIHERLSAQRDEVELGVDTVEESVVEKVKNLTYNRLERALNFISRGELIPIDSTAPATTSRPLIQGLENLTPPNELPEYPGLFGIWNWANEVKKTLVKALESEIRSVEDEARIDTVVGVERVQTELGEKYLPTTATITAAASLNTASIEGSHSSHHNHNQQQLSHQGQHQQGQQIEINERVFRPEVMFAKRRRGVGRLAARGISTGLGLGTTSSVGIGAFNFTATDFEISFLDFFDLEKIYNLTGTNLYSNSSNKLNFNKNGDRIIEDDTLETGALISLGVGGMGMIGSRLIGIKGTVESISKVFEILGSKQARAWAGPILGVLTVGLAVYVVIDLPKAVPRNIGRKLQIALSSSDPSSSSSSSSAPPTSFTLAHSERISRETRKVLRLAGWDLRERFRTALEKTAMERKEIEISAGKADNALNWLNDFLLKVEKEQRRVEGVELEL